MRKKFILNLNINHFCENLIYVNKLKTHILIINFTKLKTYFIIKNN